MDLVTFMLDKGLGIPINKEEAAHYYKMAINKEEAVKGDGIPQNVSEGIRYLQLAIKKK